MTATIEFRITFGQARPRDPHPRAPWAHRNGWFAVVVDDMATDPELAARLAAIEAIGRDWAFIYHPDDEGYPGVFRMRDGSDPYPLGELARLDLAGQPTLTVSTGGR